MISVVILTFNEGINIARCLDSLDWCDDVLIIDSGSTDDTIEIAKSRGVRVLSRAFDNFANQRNYALDTGDLKFNWVLHLDADEEVTPELVVAMREKANDPNAKPGYYVPEKLMFMGKWLRYSAQYPRYQVRFGCRERLRFIQVGHGQREALPPESIDYLNAVLVHNNFSKGISDWFTRHARYARDEAIKICQSGKVAKSTSIGEFLTDRVARRRFLKRLSNRAPFRPILRFFYNYVISRGFMDGVVGFRYSMMMMIYEYMIVLNVLEIRWRALSNISRGGEISEDSYT